MVPVSTTDEHLVEHVVFVRPDELDAFMKDETGA
jgi:hypothetical protein